MKTWILVTMGLLAGVVPVPAQFLPCAADTHLTRKGDVLNGTTAVVDSGVWEWEIGSGDTYTNIYAIVGDGFAYRELKTVGDKVRAELLRVPAVAKVDFIGEQDEKVFVEVSNAKLALLGIEPAQIYTTLAAQNVVAASGTFDTPTDRIALRPSAEPRPQPASGRV